MLLRRHALLGSFLTGLLCGVLIVGLLNNSPPPRPPPPTGFSEEVSHHEHLEKPFHSLEHGNADGHEQRRLVFFGHEHEESEAVKLLRKKVRIFCWIMTGPKNVNKARAVHNTWAPRCDKHVFITSNDSSLPNVDLNITAGRQHLWQKTKKAFEYSYKTYGQDFDWFVKADDDTFMIMENLRFMLLAYKPQHPIYFGCKFKPFVKQGYMSGGGGYVLSREALRRFVEDGLTDKFKCKQSDGGAEDLEMGKCMQNVGVVAGDSRDIHGKHRMLPLPPTAHFDEVVTKNKSALPYWFKQYIYYPYDEKGECCSDYLISFHYVGGNKMYSLFNMVYHVRAFGVNDGFQVASAEKAEAELQELAQKSARPFNSMVDEQRRDLERKKS